MALVEINFDGIVGPSHNYAGLSLGNLAATANAGSTAFPARGGAAGHREDAAQSAASASPRACCSPHRRPNRALAGRARDDDRGGRRSLRAAAFSASAMWAANAATVSPAPDTADGRCHLTVANLRTMAHRSHEWPETLAQLRLAFADEAISRCTRRFPRPSATRARPIICGSAPRHGAPGVEIFVYGVGGGPFPARQHLEASRAIARLNRLDPERTLFVAQSEEAIAAGAFHNDVVAVANEHVLFAHEQAFADKDGFYADLQRLLPEVEIVEVPASGVSLADAIRSYLFNAQLVTLPEAAWR